MSASETVGYSILILTGLVGIFYTLISMYRCVKSRSWPSVTGELLDIGYKEDTINEDTHKPAVKYKFSVNGIEYTSEQCCFGFISTSDKSLSELIIMQLEGKDSVKVSYDPNNPNISVLITEIEAYFFKQALVFSIFVVWGLIAVY